MSDNEKLDINTCFADNIKKFRKTFWSILKDWEKDSFEYIYSALPDPDAVSEKLYIFHEELWKKQCKNNPEVCKVWNGNAYQLNITDKQLSLGSDSFINIYWHWECMQKIMDKVKAEIQSAPEYKRFEKDAEQLDEGLKTLRCYDENWKENNPFKLFIWRYLQISNTIGGFIVFPRHNRGSINTKRGNPNGKIKDRFDLTLECIRRYYITQDNPLFTHIDKDDEVFFEMFGSFKNYVDFFCLQDWVNDNYEVLDLLGDTPTTLLNADEVWKENKIIPCDFDEKDQVKKWWNLYHNLMYRLEKRNKRIDEILP